MSAICLDRATGAVLHQSVVFKNDVTEPLGNPVNGYASPTGVLIGDKVYLHFGSYGTCCLDATTFKKPWERRDLPCRHYRGPGSSLVHYKDTIILTMDGIDVQYLVALDIATGKTVWKTDRSTAWNDLQPDGKPKAEGDMRKSYTTPCLVPQPNGSTMMISTGSKATIGYDAATGAELWFSTYSGFSNASSPMVLHGHVLFNTGYGKSNLVSLEISSASKGDLTEKVAWTQTKRMPLRTSPLIVGEQIYTISDDGHVSCVNPADGEVTWTERLPDLFSGSPILVENHILLCGENGNSFWLEPGNEFKQLATSKLDAGLLASPVALDHELYLRTKTHLYRVEKK
jgi:outer membrane protein assembly factor BamB